MMPRTGRILCTEPGLYAPCPGKTGQKIPGMTSVIAMQLAVYIVIYATPKRLKPVNNTPREMFFVSIEIKLVNIF